MKVFMTVKKHQIFLYLVLYIIILVRDFYIIFC